MEAPKIHTPQGIGVSERMFTKVSSPADSFTVEEVCTPTGRKGDSSVDTVLDPWSHGQGGQYPKYVGYRAW